MVSTTTTNIDDLPGSNLLIAYSSVPGTEPGRVAQAWHLPTGEADTPSRGLRRHVMSVRVIDYFQAPVMVSS